MLTLNQELAAQILKERLHARLAFCRNDNVNLEELEIDTFFHYILEQLAFAMMKYKTNNGNVGIRLVQEPFSNPDVDYIIMANGEFSSYSPLYVSSSEFYSIIQKVSDMFNEDSLEGYSSTCSVMPRKAIISVYLDSIN